MPWYRIFAKHGPGHQSFTEVYRFFEKKMLREEKKEAWDTVFDYGFEYPIGNVQLVKALPQHIYDRQVESAKYDLSHAKRMLNILANTDVKPVIVVKRVIEKTGSQPLIQYQAQLMKDESVKGKMKPTRERAANALIRQLKAKKSEFAILMRY